MLHGSQGSNNVFQRKSLPLYAPSQIQIKIIITVGLELTGLDSVI